MKILTKNQFYFSMFLLIMTIILHIGITILLNLKEFDIVWFMIPVYAIPVFFIGWHFGKKDNEELPLATTAFRFHLLTYIISNVVIVIKHVFGFASVYEKIASVYYTLIFWGFGLLLHLFLLYLLKKGRIKGISKAEIFE